MKFSHQWLSDLVEGLNADAKDVARLITLHTAESEGVETHGGLLRGACLAEVLSVEAIPNAHNVKAEVETALYGRKTVACGAPNCRAGLRTIYVPLGLKKVSGIESDGMLASPAELGINTDHDGIIELDGDLDLVPDSVIEIDNKSLTHRPDLWGHYGMAREVAAILKLELVDPVSMELLPEGEAQVRVLVEEPQLCPRFCAQLFENVTVSDSPFWLQYRLHSVGLNSINNIVDVTNWLLAELPQPTHAYDADKVNGRIIVRRAKAGEKMLALNGEEYELTGDDLIIADESGPIGIAGVIGGKATSIGPGTKRIILEAANFNAISVRKTSSRLKLRTDASMRFEKAQDPQNTLRAMARGAELFELISPGIVAVGGPTDVAAEVKGLPVIHLNLAWLYRKLGREVAKAEVIGILKRLDFGVIDKGAALEVTVPSWRATKDVSIADDLVEEVGRSIGYSTIDPVAPSMPVTPPPVNEERRFFNGLREIATQQGFHEVYNYSFISEEEAATLGVPVEAHIRVLNPIASDQSLMRTTLLHGALKNFRDNRKQFGDFRFFEIGKEIHKRAGELPEEIAHLVLGKYASVGDGAENLRELQRVAHCVHPDLKFRPAADVRVFEHPSRAAELVIAGERVGRLFEFHPNWVEGRAAVVDFDLGKLGPILAARQTRYQPIRRFPASEFDLSVVAEARAHAADIEATLRSSASGAVESIEFLMDFKLSGEKRSLSYRITVAKKDGTLTQEEITAERNAMIGALSTAGYELR